MKQQTAVEWLVEHLTNYGFNLKLHLKEISQAKQLERQQIIDAFDYPSERINDKGEWEKISGEKYYKDNYKQ
jgi:hypothetical protein